MRTVWKDYYRVLGIGRSASQQQIHKAFRELARKYHPDINPDEHAEEQFKALSEAYDVLGDPDKRRVYDDQIWGRNNQAEASAAERNWVDVREPGAAGDFPAPDVLARRTAAADTVSKMSVAIVIAFGLPTFFMPFVTTDSPVRGRSEFTPLQLLVSRADLWRPAPGPFHIHMVLYQIALVYLLMPITLLALALPRPRKVLQFIALIGVATSVNLVGTASYRGFGWLFYGRFTNGPLWDGSLRGLTRWHGFQCELGFYIFLAVMPLLTWIVHRGPRQ